MLEKRAPSEAVMDRMPKKIRMYLDLRFDRAPRPRPMRRDDGLEPAPVEPRPTGPKLAAAPKPRWTEVHASNNLTPGKQAKRRSKVTVSLHPACRPDEWMRRSVKS